MARPINYLFCRYSIHIEEEILGDAAEFALIAENQGAELVHGREKDGVQPQTLCTDPLRINIEGPRTHSFEIGFKPGTRVRQEYDEVTKKRSLQLERDNHTKFGHVITIHELGAMAIRDRTSDDTIGAYQTISALRSFIQGVSNGDGQITFVHSDACSKYVAGK